MGPIGRPSLVAADRIELLALCWRLFVRTMQPYLIHACASHHYIQRLSRGYPYDNIVAFLQRKAVATRLLGKGQTFVVGRETSLTCVSAGGNPAPRIKFILTRGNESRVYQPRSVHDTYPTTGNVALIQRKVSFIPDWSMYGWTIECQCSNAHHSVWNSTVNGLVPARGDQFLPDGNFEYRQLFWSGSSAETSRDSMAISLTEGSQSPHPSFKVH